MKHRVCLLFLLFVFVLRAQIPQNIDGAPISGIIRSSLADTLLFHLELKNAGFDAKRNNLPVFAIQKTTEYNENANPSLIIKQVSLVKEPHASVIRKFFLPYLTSDFSLTALNSLVKNKNNNNYLLVPFRLNSANQIEELISYTVDWKISSRPLTAGRGPSNFKTTSVLATGSWYKIAVTQTGLYRINRSFLNDMGIDSRQIDPRTIQLYGNGGKMLPELNAAPRIDDLAENAIKVVGEEDGSFDVNDYILFYAEGPDEWRYDPSQKGLKYQAIKNLYSDTSFYFITIGQTRGKRISQLAASNGTALKSTGTYDYFAFHEQDVVNFGKSGRQFFGEYFDITNSYSFKWDDGGFVIGDSLATEVKLVASYTKPTEFQVSGNGQNFKVITSPVSGALYSDYAGEGRNKATVLNTNDAVLAFNITKLTDKSLGWLDKLTINARRNLTLGTRQFNFRDSRVVGNGNVAQYNISIPLNANPILWDVTDPSTCLEQNYLATPSSLAFSADASQLREYCISLASDLLSPVYVGKVSNQNLHSLQQADYVIITHPLFINEARRLALFHQKTDGYTYCIATTDQIYNEFSSGRQDIAAIRDFIRMLYLRSKDSRPVKYALMLGDGSYLNKSRNLVNNSNFIPTYQSNNSLSSTISLATDDFYGMMDDNEGYSAEDTGDPDIGVGRLTCRTVPEVRAVLDKIEHYYTTDNNFQVTAADAANCNTLNESTLGDWRNWLVFLGDDQDNAEHMQQSDGLTKIVARIDTNYNFDKIFLDAYQRFSTPGGPRYPDASADFIRRMKKGALIFNYTGHGGEVGLTAERMIDIDIINNLDNFNKLPLYITATCEFSRYDDPSRTSAGELCLLNAKGAAIALFTTCRLAFSGPNYELNKITLEKLFTPLADGSMPTLGEAIQSTKTDPRIKSMTQYYTNFHLLGDPALRLAYPKELVKTTQINSRSANGTIIDTLGALEKVTIKGYVADKKGNKLSNFNGLVYPTVFDKEQKVVALLNTVESATNYYAIEQGADSGPFKPYQFNLQKNILYRGKVSVINGEFSYSFMVPKDISFSVGPGKISYYATDGKTDAHGYFNKLMVGGSASEITKDTEGPKIELYLNDKNFISGGLTNERPVLYADLTDSSGINTLGSSIGHDISVVLDENTSRPVVLNDYYEAALNSYQSGRVRYPYSDLSEGQHRLTFKVWDIQNNSSQVYTDFIVAKSSELALKHVLNYPNPFTTRTKFYFEHNQACNPLKVNIQVYTISGKLVKTIQQTVLCEGYRPEGVEWDGKDDFGDKLGRGVYIYKVSILDVQNKKAEKIEKLVILN